MFDEILNQSEVGAEGGLLDHLVKADGPDGSLLDHLVKDEPLGDDDIRYSISFSKFFSFSL